MGTLGLILELIDSVESMVSLESIIGKKRSGWIKLLPCLILGLYVRLYLSIYVGVCIYGTLGSY